MAAKKEKPLIPPEESMWQKYSSHFEFPLAGATSIFLHSFVIGIIAIGGIGFGSIACGAFPFFLSPNAEATKPPNMDVIMVEGEGTGFEGLGGEPGLPGAPDAGGGKRTEFISPLPNDPDPRPKPRFEKDVLPELGLPVIEDGKTPLSGELFLELARINKEADDQVKKAMEIPSTPSVGPESKKMGPIGTGKPKGTGGLGGLGGGTSFGKKPGPGTGTGGIGGRKATAQEIKAWRWRFDLAGDGPEHARKLAAVGVTVAFPDPKGGFFLVTDLNRRPVDMKRDSLLAFKDAVKWYNGRPESVQALARELQLPFTPKFVVLLLPKDREQKLANEEKRYADENRRAVESIQFTQFDFRLRNGAYDPVVIDQK